jgi:hypothetical protein
MIDFKKHHKRLEDAIGVRNPSTDKNCADEMDEHLWWNEVMRALNEISIESADELQEDTGKTYSKDSLLVPPAKSIEELLKMIGKLDSDYTPLKDASGNFIGVRRNLRYSKAPPTRLLSMTLILCYWLGFMDASGTHALDPGGIGAWDRIKKAYDNGKAYHPDP